MPTLVKDLAHQRRLWRSLAIASSLALVLGLAGCHAPVEGGSTSHTAQISAQSAGVADIESQDDLREARPTHWTAYEQLDEYTIRVHFTLGSPTCYGARATLRETTQTIGIAVVEGTLPDAPKTCAAVAALVSMVVTTHDPISAREIVQP